MASTIKGIQPTPGRPISQGSHPQRAAPTHGRGRPSGGDRVDTVSITSTAASLHDIEGILSDIPVADAEKVDTIRDSIADGTYQINPRRIADKLIQFEFRYPEGHQDAGFRPST